MNNFVFIVTGKHDDGHGKSDCRVIYYSPLEISISNSEKKENVSLKLSKIQFQCAQWQNPCDEIKEYHFDLKKDVKYLIKNRLYGYLDRHGVRYLTYDQQFLIDQLLKDFRV